jgi:hypothetical protein
MEDAEELKTLMHKEISLLLLAFKSDTFVRRGLTNVDTATFWYFASLALQAFFKSTLSLNTPTAY